MKPSLRLPTSCALLWLGLNSASRSAAAFELNISGYTEQDGLHREVGAWIGIRIPFERFARSPVSSSLEEPLGVQPPGAHASSVDASFDPLLLSETLLDVSLDPAQSVTETSELEQLTQSDARTEGSARPEPESVAQSTPPLPAAPAASRPPVESKPTSPAPWHLSPAKLRGLVAAVLAEHALRVARLSGLSDRARSSAWLPELKFRAGRNSDQTLRLTPTTEDPDRWALSGGSGFRLEGEVRWQFDRLVFASEEVPVERMRLVLEQQRQRGILDLLEWVFRWQIAVMRRSDAEATPSERLEAALTAEQMAGALDVLSGGWFSAHVSSPSTSASER